MRVGVPTETKTAEARVALTPDGVRELRQHGHAVTVQSGAGDGSAISDAQFRAAGAVIVDAEEAWAADLVVKVKEPQPAEYRYLRGDPEKQARAKEDLADLGKGRRPVHSSC